MLSNLLNVTLWLSQTQAVRTGTVFLSTWATIWGRCRQKEVPPQVCSSFVWVWILQEHQNPGASTSHPAPHPVPPATQTGTPKSFPKQEPLVITRDPALHLYYRCF